MNEVELRARVNEYLKSHDMTMIDYGRQCGLGHGVVNRFLKGGHVRDRTFEKIKSGLTRDTTKKNLIIDLNNPASVLEGMEQLDEYKRKLDDTIQALEDKLSMYYKLREMLGDK